MPNQLPSTREAIVFDDHTHPVSRTLVKDTLRDGMHSWRSALTNYLIGLFPIATWLPHYNFTWLTGDLIAGITIGCVVVPQGMAYARIATLPPEYGLYSSFVGVFIYCFFATSKDMTIGPTAVMSLLLSQIIASITSETSAYSPVVIASAYALMVGVICAGLGLLRLGFIVDFIPNPAIAGFMTGSAITIALGQIPKLLGIKSVDTRAAGYLVLGNSLAGLPRTSLDAAFGLTGLFILYAIRFVTTRLINRYPRYKWPLFFVNIARNILLVIVFTAIAYGISKDNPDKPPISILKNVPSGFRDVHVPHVDVGLLQRIAPNLPSAVIIVVLEHIAIAKSFGRVNDYKINPNQELIAIGVSNIIASFFSAYPSTGSFSRSAIKAKSGVRTPLAGIFSGIIVILALYALTPAFYYIPDATLAAVIIHAVGDLVVGPNTWKHYWKVNPFELLIFIVSVVVTFFVTVEWGIYISVILSVLLLLLRIARPRYSILGRVPVESNEKDHARYVYVPIEHRTLKTTTEIQCPPPGILIFRFEEALTYPNANFIADRLIEYVEENTRRAGERPKRKGDRPWNDAGDKPHIRNSSSASTERDKPVLKALVFDFSGVPHVDTTGLQMLMDVRAQLNRYADRNVDWHFANIIDGSVRRSLITGGFGIAKAPKGPAEVAPVVSSHNQAVASSSSTSPTASVREDSLTEEKPSVSMVEEGQMTATELEVLDHTPFFHVDLDEAVRVAAKDWQ
ncbi:uncharacterized protein VTP21DRAFT_7479 [Calcarisporiella thermophila]|uniref:uncharacterized protein n=1 Tax=Calcarisporiella thermophila TaxID=911321 RepID=UPI00374267DB